MKDIEIEVTKVHRPVYGVGVLTYTRMKLPATNIFLWQPPIYAS